MHEEDPEDDTAARVRSYVRGRLEYLVELVKRLEDNNRPVVAYLNALTVHRRLGDDIELMLALHEGLLSHEERKAAGLPETSES